MTKEKITVNDALISTDVDSLIRTISERRKVGLYELVNLCSMDRRSVEKWVRVLEDEGYISINYGIRGTTIIWLAREQDAQAEAKEIDSVLDAMPASSVPESKEPEALDPGAFIEPEKRLEQYLRKKQDIEDIDENSLKSNILESLDDEAVGQGAVPEDEEELAQEAEEDLPDGIPEPPKPGLIKKPERIDQSPRGAQVKELLNAYINQINEEKAVLEKLRAEKDRAYRENYLAIESKVEADIASITEKILEKEGRILEIRERIAGLPAKVGEISAIHNSVKKLEEDGKSVLSKTKESVDRFIKQMDKGRGEISSQMEKSRQMLENEKLKVSSLGGLSESIEEQIQSLDRNIDLTRSQMDKLNSQLRDLLDDLEEATEMKVEVGDMVEQVRASIEEKDEELDGLQSALDGMEKVERWAREYVVDYQRKIDEISDYVAQTETDLTSLSEHAESEYINKYLNELDRMSEAYDALVNDSAEQERALEEKAAASRKRLASLVKESKDMVRKLRQDHSVDFVSKQGVMAKRSGRMLQMLEEKEAERGKLGEDILRARERMTALPRPVASRKRRKSGNKKAGRGRKKK